MPLNIQKELAQISQAGATLGHSLAAALGNALDLISKGVNSLGQNSGADPTGTIPSPPQVQSLTVKSNGTGLVHATISDNNPITKNLHYFLEYDTNPAFSQPHVMHLGASRSIPPITLPAQDDNGNAQQFYFRAYSQYPGGDPGAPQHFGGTTPTPVSPGGTQKLTLIPSTGSGTAQNTGQQGGSGFGKVLFRPAVAPKRQS
jgi:hypothetical protein